MGEVTGISWTDHTFNPWIGCAKVSPGCANCYAEVAAPTRVSRASGLELWGVNGARKLTSNANWAQPRKWARAAAAAGVRRRVFCASLADVFEDRDELDPWRRRLFDLISLTPELDWLLLTKRPENIRMMLPDRFSGWSRKSDEPRPNIWLGTTAEDQKRADERLPKLLELLAPGVVRFVSVEPQIGPVDLTRYLKPTLLTNDGRRLQHPDPEVAGTGGRWYWGLDWVIVGGESGDRARPFCIDWARSLVKQCGDAQTACFVKQLGRFSYEESSSAPYFTRDRAGADPAEWPDALRVQQFPMEAR